MFSLFTLQGVNYLLPLITIPYLVRVLGTDNFGRIVFAQAFIQYFLVITDYGFNLSATRSVAMRRDDPEGLSSLFSAVMFIKTMFFLSGFILLILITTLVPSFKQDWFLYLVVYLTGGIGNVLLPVWLFQGLEHMRYLTVLTILSRLVFLGFIFLFVRSSEKYLLAAAFQSGSLLLAAVPAFVGILRIGKIHLCWPGFDEINQVLRDGWHVFLGMASVCLFTNSNVFLLGMMTNPQSVAYFSVAEKLVRAVTGVTVPIAQSVYPHIAKLATESREAAYVFIRRLIRFQGGITLLLSFTLFIFAGPIVTLLFGDQFKLSILLVRWMALLPFLIGINNILGTQVMINFGMQKAFARILIGIGLCSVALMIPMILWFATEGAAITVFIVEFLQTVMMIVTLKNLGYLSGLLGKTFLD
jgi:PST family polysaccharide transporter